MLRQQYEFHAIQRMYTALTRCPNQIHSFVLTIIFSTCFMNCSHCVLLFYRIDIKCYISSKISTWDFLSSKCVRPKNNFNMEFFECIVNCLNANTRYFLIQFLKIKVLKADSLNGGLILPGGFESCCVYHAIWICLRSIVLSVYCLTI